MDTLTSSQLARASGVGVETLRFYERQGLLPEPPRTGSGYRQYPAPMVGRMRFIRKAKDMGFSLREIGELLDLKARKGRSCGDVKKLALVKIKEVSAMIEELKNVGAALGHLVAQCSQNVSLGDCPIVEFLEGETSTKPWRPVRGGKGGRP